MADGFEGIHPRGNTGKRSYSLEEVTSMLGVCRQTVYKLIKRGCFKAVMVDHHYRIIKSSFDSWLDGE